MRFISQRVLSDLSTHTWQAGDSGASECAVCGLLYPDAAARLSYSVLGLPRCPGPQPEKETDDATQVQSAEP